MANDCDLSALICNDADQTITNFVEQKGYITSFVYGGVRNSSPLIRLMERTKKEFPEGNGDTFVRGVLEVTSPNELDGMNWTPVKTGYPGNSPCCNTYRDFTYGSRTVTGCLSQIGYRSPSFCKVDIVMKSNFMEQLMQIIMAMQNVTTGVWDSWLKHSYPKSVYCTTLSQMWGHPEQLGQYSNSARPTTFIKVEHLDQILERVQSAGGLIGSPIKGYQVIVIGRNSFNRMKRRRMEQNATLVGARGADFSLPSYNEFTTDFGTVVAFSGYAFIVIDKPRRFREKTNSESWDDALIPSTVNVPTDKGERTERNGDYYNPNVAVYEETLWLNLQAVDWLIPPSALTKKAISTGGKEFFPAINYAGDFEAIHCPEDPKKKTVQFMAEFMGGMVSLFPQKGRAIMHRACHIEACDDDDQVCVGGSDNGTSTSSRRAIRWTGVTANAGELQFLIEGDMFEACPAGYSLFVTTEKGFRFLVGSVGATSAFAGNSTYPKPGQYVTIDFADNDAATLRDACDPWKFIECMPNSTAASTAADAQCGLCRNSSTLANPCTLRVVVAADRIRGLKLSDGTNVISVTNYTSAATLESAIQAALDATYGGGTVTVTGGTAADGYEWVIEVVDNTTLVDAVVIYDDGISAAAEITLGASGDCQTS